VRNDDQPRSGGIFENFSICKLMHPDVTSSEELTFRFALQNSNNDVIVKVVVSQEAGLAHDCPLDSDFMRARKRRTTGGRSFSLSARSRL